MKFEIVRNKLIIVGAVCGAILLAFFTAYYFVSGYNETLSADIITVRGETMGVQVQTEQINKDVTDASAAYAFYDWFLKSKDSDPQNFRREVAKTLIRELSETSKMVNAVFSMGTFERMEGDHNKGIVAFYATTVTVQFFANSDVKAFEFIKNLCEKFPGEVKIKSMSLIRTQQINDNLLIAVGQGNAPDGIVSGQVEFEWRAIQDNLDYVKPEAPAAPGQPQKIIPGARPNA